jgi:hypothetical protein
MLRIALAVLALACAVPFGAFRVTLGDAATRQEARRHFSKLPQLLVNAFPNVNQKFKTAGSGADDEALPLLLNSVRFAQER